MEAYPEELILKLYKTMFTIRRFEETVSELGMASEIPSAMIHLYVGEEAVATGVEACLREDDYIVSTHRGHGHLIAKGGSLKRTMAELMGKEEGYCRGRGGSMHITDVELGGLGANGIVGAGLVIAPGAALSARLRGTDQVTVCFFGDGASNQGTFHEGLNLASLWNLPVVFVCENNGYGEFTAQREHQKIDRISRRADSYGMPGITVDGNDVLEVYAAASWAVERARKGAGPALIEAVTNRWYGHYLYDPDEYRSEEEKARFEEEDCIKRLEDEAVERGLAAPAVLEQVRSEVEKEIEEARVFAEEGTDPLPEEDLGLIYAGGE